MLKRAMLALAVLALCGAAAVVTGCGKGGGKEGGTIRIGTLGPDKYDPALFQTLQGIYAFHLVYTPLVTYRNSTGDSSVDLVPGVAQSVPKPTNGGTTYKFKLR